MKRPKQKQQSAPAHQKNAPQAALVRTASRRYGIGKWWPVAVLLALVGMYYFPILFCKGFLWNDFVEQNFPYRLFAAVSLRHGELPLWTPYVFSGMPFFADV